MTDQAARLRQLAMAGKKAPEPLAGGKAIFMAVASGKGGVGKTSLVANLGCALSKRGRKVLALDADFGLANLDIILNLGPGKNLGHFLKGEATAEDIVKEAAPGFSVLPGASGIDGLADMDSSDRQRIVSGLSVLSGRFDYVLIDVAAGIGRNVIELCLAANDVLLVTDPQPTSLTDAYGLAKILMGRSPGIDLRVVVNSVKSAEEGRAVYAKLNEVVKRFLKRELEYAGHIARDDFVSKATSRQEPFVSAYPRSAAAKCVEELADGILDRKGGRAGNQAFWSKLGERESVR